MGEVSFYLVQKSEDAFCSPSLASGFVGVDIQELNDTVNIGKVYVVYSECIQRLAHLPLPLLKHIELYQTGVTTVCQ